ncbi:MAG: hypothetical protein Q4D51_11045 [Eubacteriales bacterium]|nr:hypothetical protein [Eubacteriales bacterium]
MINKYRKNVYLTHIFDTDKIMVKTEITKEKGGVCDMIIVPERQEYTLDFAGHKILAGVATKDDEKVLTISFDDKVISTTKVDVDDVVSYSNVIADGVLQYIRSKKDKYADLVMHHADKIKLVSITITMATNNYGLDMNMILVIEKGYYTFKTFSPNMEDKLVCQLKAYSFTEAYEKLRTITGYADVMVDGVGVHLTDYVHDRIVEKFEWFEK